MAKVKQEQVVNIKDTQEVVNELVRLQRTRAATLKTAIMNENRLKAVIACSMGYAPKMDEAERKKQFEEAGKLIERITDFNEPHHMKDFVIASQAPINSLRQLQVQLEKQMEEYASKLSVCEWVKRKEQAGFGLLSLAKVIGETGNLSNYSNPAKVWRRMGCMPWKFEGEGVKYNPHKMGSTWRGGKEGKLPASEWETFGYSPRRRCIAYQISDVLIKLNKSVYRARYVEAKVKAYENHPEWDWKPCVPCEGTGSKFPDEKTVGIKVTCQTCGGTGKKTLRAHLHGMLLAVKLLLKNLWGEWNGWPPYERWWEANGQHKS